MRLIEFVSHSRVKTPVTFPGAPLIFNGAPGNIQGKLTGIIRSYPYTSILKHTHTHITSTAWCNRDATSLLTHRCVPFALNNRTVSYLNPIRFGTEQIYGEGLLMTSIDRCVCVRFKMTLCHYDDLIMTMLASQITSLTVVYSIVYSGVNQRNIKAPRHWPLCGEFTGTGEFPAQMASNAENVSIWWRHHAITGPLCMESTGGSQHKLPAMRNFDVFVVVSLDTELPEIWDTNMLMWRHCYVMGLKIVRYQFIQGIINSWQNLRWILPWAPR